MGAWLRCLAFGLAWAAPAAASCASLALQIDRLGHVFAPNECVTVTMAGAVRTVRWVVSDMFGTQVQNGRLTTQGGEVALTLMPGRNGWFQLVARDEAGQSAQTTWAVVPLPDAVPTDRFAVMTHFAQAWDTDVLPLVARAGIGQIRDELYWEEVEKAPGQYALPERYRHYLDAATAQSLKLLLVLSFANPLYDGGNTPYTPAGRAAFGAYGAYLATTLKGRLSGLEVWNEFNGSFCKGPCENDRPAAYTALLAAAYSALKKAAPAVPVAGGAAALVPTPWFQALADHGALTHLDAVVVHPYRAVADGVEYPLDALGQLLKARRGGQSIPVWATEFSHFDKRPDGGAETARYLVREAALMLESGVTRLSWYLLRDYAEFKTMGLLAGPDDPRGRYAPAPAYPAFATLIRELDGAAPQGRERTDPRTRLYRFQKGADAVHVGWTSESTIRLRLEAQRPIERIDLMGNTTALTPTNGRIEVTLDHNPIYLRGAIAAIHEDRSDVRLADSVGGFTGTPTASADWSYGGYRCEVQNGGTDACLAGYPAATLLRLEWRANDWDWAWRAPRYPALEVAIDTAHPSAAEGFAVWSVRRWTARKAGLVTLTGTVGRASPRGDGTDALILVDGRPIWHETLGRHAAPDERVFALKARVHAGSRIDFAVTPGPGTDIDSDATSLTISIAQGGAGASAR